MIEFVHPEAFLLLPLAALWLRRRLWPRPLVGALRVLLLALLAALLAQPSWPGERDGRDVVLVVDRSRSMPSGDGELREFAAAVGAALRPGDRLGVVAFGRQPAVSAPPRAPFVWPDAERVLDRDGTDLAAAVLAGAALVPPGRHGSLLVWSDGEHRGGDLEAAARAVVRQGLRIDTHHVPRAAGADTAVVELQAPAAVALGEPFALAAVVVSDRAGIAHWRLLADGEVVREGDATLQPGRNVLQFRRTLLRPGQHELAVEVQRAGDPVPWNDRGLCVVRATAPRRVVCVTPGGREDRLTRSLRAAGFDVDAVAPPRAPLSLGALDGTACVVLEDVPAGELPPGAMGVLQRWVEDLGGGLLMTGGKASFGIGGFHKTPVEQVLPVTMELREEQRRFGLAMAIALDRSGSMQVDAGGQTKMQLADIGAASAIELLSPIDAVAVIAVDSAPHTVVPLQPVTDRAALAAQVRTIESMGGGIYVGAALFAAAQQLAASTQQNRHILLFADAADAEEPGDYRSFVPELVRSGVTVSVIGLGSETDSDAELLREIARLGNGRCQFVLDANDLPRVFAQETIQVARSSMVEQPTTAAALPGLRQLGDVPATFPELGGYTLAWRRPEAEVALIAQDEHAAPLLSYRQAGLGRTAAFLGEVDGPLAGGLADWDRYGDFFATLVRWLGGGQHAGLYVDASRVGSEGRIALEVDAAQAALLDTARGVVTTPDGRSEDLVFERPAPGRLLARVPLRADGVYRAAVQVAGATVRVPPLCLPYSPEWQPEPDPRAGERLLRRLALATGGSVQPAADAVVAGPRTSRGRLDLGPFAALAAVLVLLLEIAVRRLHVELPSLRWRRAAAPAVAPAATPTLPSAPTPPPSAPALPPSPPSPPPAEGVLGALERARQRGRRRP
ncbi:MAG: VWA domain-containing protein [Planctomycetes bacterium]|nr:VWA domain-containing protein [Planctomycetota bacterium]